MVMVKICCNLVLCSDDSLAKNRLIREIHNMITEVHVILFANARTLFINFMELFNAILHTSFIFFRSSRTASSTGRVGTFTYSQDSQGAPITRLSSIIHLQD